MEHEITRTELLSDCPMRHPENGNCGPAGSFCQPGTEICKAMQSAYSAGRNDTAMHAVPPGLSKLLQRLECPNDVLSCEHLERFGHSCVQCANNAATEAAAAIRTLLGAGNEMPNTSPQNITTEHTEESLTLEELRDMDGKTVWCVSIHPMHPFTTCLMIVDADIEIVYDSAGGWLSFATYGERWLAYEGQAPTHEQTNR